MSADVAVITGGSRGIGADLAKRMLSEGYQVIAIARHPVDFSDPKLEFIEADLFDQHAVTDVAEDVAKRFNVTHFVHNAGAIWPNLVEQAMPDDIIGLAQLHLGSALTLLQSFLPSMKGQHFGRVIFNASRAALGTPTRTAYSATKAGMIGMARTWALELAQHQVTVNVVAPGPIQTDNFWDIVPKGSPRESDLAKRIPVGRLGTVSDVTNAMMFFADRRSSFVTGQTLFVCGGSSVGGVSI